MTTSSDPHVAQRAETRRTAAQEEAYRLNRELDRVRRTTPVTWWGKFQKDVHIAWLLYLIANEEEVAEHYGPLQ